MPELFNAGNDDNEADARSDDKGPEPEGLDVGVIGGRTYVFVDLERIGGIMVYDVTIPESPAFITYLNNRDPEGNPEAGTAGDLAPEGVLFVDAADSPNGKPLLIVGNEVSGSTTVYTIEVVDGEISFAVFSDPHLYDTHLGDSGTAFETYLASDRKLLLQSDAILKTTVEKIVADKNLDFVIVPGDLTKDGERVCHEAFAAYMKTIEDAGINVFVIPGNHDINNPHAYAFDGETTIPVDNVSPSLFEQLYADYGYDEALYRDPNSLSYVVEPVEGLWLLAMDSCDYDDNEFLGKPVTSGNFSADTREWILDILDMAQTGNKRIIGMMHHGLLEHFTGQSSATPGSEYVIEDWENLSETFAKAGLHTVFTGHFHANDVTIKQWEENGTTYSLTDAETGSLVTYPSPYRFVRIDSENSIILQTRYVQKIDYDTGDQSFPDSSKDFITMGVENLAYGMFTASTEDGGYGLSAELATVLAPQFADAFVAHYAGDEAPDEATLATIDAYLSSEDAATQMLGLSLESLWSDLAPRDSSCSFEPTEKK